MTDFQATIRNINSLLMTLDLLLIKSCASLKRTSNSIYLIFVKDGLPHLLSLLRRDMRLKSIPYSLYSSSEHRTYLHISLGIFLNKNFRFIMMKKSND